MSKRDDGGSAFPFDNVWTEGKGMSLRDWFAGQALAGWYVNGGDGASYEASAEIAYKIADAMLKARGES